jgi:hypothetical protein
MPGGVAVARTDVGADLRERAALVGAGVGRRVNIDREVRCAELGLGRRA